MNHFIDPYARLLLFVLDKLHKSPSLILSCHIDRTAFFKQKVSTILASGVDIKERVYTAPYPQLFTTQINVNVGGFHQASFGIATNQDRATFVAQAELLERLSTWLPLDSAVKLAFNKKKIGEEFPKEIRLQSVLGRRSLLAPVSEVYWGIAQDKSIPYHVTTSGTATHTTYDRAVLHAWLELIERDAFFVHWLQGISPKHIDTAKLEEEDASFRDKLKQLREAQHTLYILDITTDIAVLTCLALLIVQTEKGYSFGVSAKTSFDAKSAIVNSVMDAVAVAYSVEGVAPYILPESYVPFKDQTITKEKRLALYKTKEAIENASFLWSSSESISYEDFRASVSGVDNVKAELRYLQEIFKKRYREDARYDVFEYTCRNKLLSFFGFHVVRVICRGLYPIYLTESFASPDHPRLEEFARYKGLENTVRITTFPHPFS